MFLGRVLWRALATRLRLIFGAAFVAAPWVITKLAAAYPGIGLPMIGDVWAWTVFVAVACIAAVFILRLVALEKALVPKLELSPDDDVQGERRTFRIQVKNVSQVDLDNCLLVVDDLRYPGGARSPSVPAGLATQNQILEDRHGPFHLRPGQRKYVHVASLDEGRHDSDIVMAWESSAIPHKKLPRATRVQPYKMTIQALGAGQPSVRAFDMYVDEANKLVVADSKPSVRPWWRQFD